MNEIKKRLDNAYEIAMTNQDYAGAIKLCDQVILEYPSIPDGFNARARILELSGDLSEAVKDMNSAIEIEPNEPDYYFNRGRWHLGLGNFNDAVDDQTRVLAIGVTSNFHYYDETAFFFRAAAFLQLSMFQNAISDCGHVSDDFVTYSPGLGRLTKAEIVSEASKHVKGPAS